MTSTHSQKVTLRTFMLLQPTRWWTLAGLVNELNCRKLWASEAGVSARLRDLRKDGYTVERERVRPGSSQYQYRISLHATEGR